MRQRLTSIILILTLTASVIAGAIGVSINFANADDPSGYTGYLDDLLEEARDYYVTVATGANISYFDEMASYARSHFDTDLIVIYHTVNTDYWYFAIYEPRTDYTFNKWVYNESYHNLRAYYGNTNRSFKRMYAIKFGDGTVRATQSTSIDTATGNLNSFSYTNNDLSYSPSNEMFAVSGLQCYFNFDIYSYSSPNYSLLYSHNLEEGSYVRPIIEYDWFKFNLGDRWYITTYDQSLVNMMPTGDDTFWVWSFDVYRYDSDDPSVLTLFSSDMQYISYAENFISQNLTNVSSSGVYCYDVTDYINSAEYIFFAQASFYQVLDYPGGMVLGDVMAESDDVVYMSLSAQEEDPARNEAWTIINNYFENYPTVTIVPDQLASQLAGNKAVTGGSGKIQIPEQLYMWRYSGATTWGIDSDFHYDLSTSGLDPDDSTQASMINYDILNVCIIPSRPDATLDFQYGELAPLHLSVWDYRYENDPNNDYKVNISVAATMTYEDVFDFFDLVLIVPGDVFCTLDPRSTYTWSNITSTFGLDARMAYTGGDIVRGNFAIQGTGDAEFPCYWVLTDNAVRKSQLYVFCDGFNKLYNLASEYVRKKDLWDNSFFEWSMSIFYQLESLNGHLSAIKTSIQSIDSKIDTMIQNLQDLNTDPTEDTIEPWYLSLWNFVRQFNPSNDQVSTGINALSDNLEDLPALPAPSAAPALPTFAP